MSAIVAASGAGIYLPSKGRSFWQDPNDGEMICLFASGNNEVDYVTSSNSGITWESAKFAFPIDDFSTHNNFDSSMDRDGNLHCVHRFNASGCYTVLGKKFGGGWTASGVVARGFCNARGFSNAGDFNGSIEVYDELLFESSLAFDGGGTAADTDVPQAIIVGVTSNNRVEGFVADTPFLDFPLKFDDIAAAIVTASGGFPIPTNVGGVSISQPRLLVPWYLDASIVPASRRIIRSSYGLGAVSEDSPAVLVDASAPDVPNTTVKSSGFIGDVSFGHNMAWHRTHSDFIFPVLTSVGRPSPEAFELYTTAFEINGDGKFFGRVDSSQAQVFTGTTRRLNTTNLPFKDVFFPDVAGSTPQLGGGCCVDISHFNKPGDIHLYFQQRQPNGSQTVFRIKANVEAQDAADSSSKTRYTFSDLSHAESGIVSWADTSLSTAGGGSTVLGSGNLVHWQGFKAIKSPVAAGQGATKTEVLVTAGSGVTNGAPDSLSKLYMWRFDDSIAASETFTTPTFASEYTADSGNTFVGFSLSAGSIAAPNALFDGDVATSGAISGGDSITLEFANPLTFNRIEFVWNSDDIQPLNPVLAAYRTFLGVDVQSSFDDVTYSSVVNIPSGIFGGPLGGEQPPHTFGDPDPPARGPSLIKVSSEYDLIDDLTVTQTMNEFSGKFVKFNFTSSDFEPRDVREIRLYGGHTTAGSIATSGYERTFTVSNTFPGRENFLNIASGVPTGWRTYGDWLWEVDSGSHESGIFVGQTIGSGDISAIRTQRSAPPNSSGVLEVDFLVENISEEISFDLKIDLISNAGLVESSDPSDDTLEFFIIPPTGNAINRTDNINFAIQTNPNNWCNVTVSNSPLVPILPRPTTLPQPVETGIHTARWVYTRGDRIVGNTGVGLREGAAWIDNVIGLEPESTLPQTSLYSYIKAANTQSGVINAYQHAPGVASGSIQSYVEGLFSSPTGSINAYVGEFEESMSIHAYVSALRDFGDIRGYTKGFIDTASSKSNAYILNSGSFDSLFGHMQSSLNEKINAYLLAPSGGFSTINSYIVSPETMIINGYLKTAEDENLSISAYLKANGVQDSTYGFMLASGIPSNSSYAYIRADGAFESIHSYITTGDDQSIDGYMVGTLAATGVINSWIDGVGAIAPSINSYIPGISGTISEKIHGFMSAVEVPGNRINGHIVGFGGTSQCDFPVPNPASVSIPSGLFF